MMTVRQLIKKLQQLQDLDKEVLVNADEFGGFRSIQEVDPCDEDCPGYLIWIESEPTTDEIRSNGPR